VKEASGSGSGNTNGKSGFDVMADELKRQVSMGVLRKGSAESRMNVVKMDYKLPRVPDMKKSKSQPATKVRNTDVAQLNSHGPLIAQQDFCSGTSSNSKRRSFHLSSR
jgi:hypothetical protein